MHAKCIEYVLVCIPIHAKTNQHLLAAIKLVFGMYEIMMRANTVQIHAFFANTC